MLHGLFTGSAASWYFTAAPAIARHLPVRLLDWRGHGLSERTPSGYDSAAMTGDLADLTAELPPFAVAAHSWGAVIAVRFALAHAGRVTRLALVDPPFIPPAKRVRRLFRDRAVPPQRPPMAELARTKTPGLRMLLEQTSVLADLAADPPVTEAELARLAGTPVLAVVGSRSPFRPAAEMVARALPEAACRVLGGGHDLHISAKGRLTPLLVDFFLGGS
jgi:pimeloyl-ACP methyl ester carboxylesterase